MKLTKSRLNKIMNCKVQTRKKRNQIKTDTNTIVNTNTNTKRRYNRHFNLRNNTVKNWTTK